MTRLVWALHALIDSNKANQLSFQAASGIPLLIQLLAQVRTSSPSQAPPPLTDSGLTPTSSMNLSHSFGPLPIEASARGGPSGNTAQNVAHTEQAQLATALVWLVGSVAADVPPNQHALHEAGAVQLLLHEIQSNKVPGVVQGSMFALGSVVKGNTDIQSEVELQVSVTTAQCRKQALVSALRQEMSL